MERMQMGVFRWCHSQEIAADQTSLDLGKILDLDVKRKSKYEYKSPLEILHCLFEDNMKIKLDL